MSENASGSRAVEWFVWSIFAAVAILAILLVGSCGKKTPEDDLEQKNFLWIEHAKDTVRGQMKDPGSADFRGLAVRRQSGAPLVCGEVNGKNSFGGMTGYQRFIFMGSLGVVMQEQMKPGEFAELWNKTCTY